MKLIGDLLLTDSVRTVNDASWNGRRQPQQVGVTKIRHNNLLTSMVIYDDLHASVLFYLSPHSSWENPPLIPKGGIPPPKQLRCWG